MPARSKTAQLQIRVSPAEKAAIQRAARRAGLDMSAYVLERALPAPARRFAQLLGACRDLEGSRFELAALSAWLADLGAGELREALDEPPPRELPLDLATYVAAMVEFACARRGVAPPAWTGSIPPLAQPYFGSPLQRLRLHLLTHSPPPFRRRNLFVDASVGAQV
jgi:hypothetical protein